MKTTRCAHPARTMTRETINLGEGVSRVEDTCGICRATRFYIRNDRARTMTNFEEWRTCARAEISMSEENFMLYVAGGKLSFKCNNEVWPAPRKECRGNVFHKDAKGGFVCNSCGARYVGSPATDARPATS